MKKWLNITFWVIVFGALLFGGYTYYHRNQQEQEQAEVLEQIEEVIEVPDFTLQNLNGEKVRLSDYQGKVVILNFWAMRCRFCVEEMPDFENAHQQLEKQGDAVILTINVREPVDRVRQYIEKEGFNMPVLLDEKGEVAAMYDLRSFPTTYIINPDGTLYNGILGKTDKETILNVAKIVARKR